MFSWTKASVCFLYLFSIYGCQSYSARTIAQDSLQNSEVEAFDVQLTEGKYPEKLSEYKPFQYEVLFTDPECGVYKYITDVYSQSGRKLTQKPENVYCKSKYDLKRSGERPQSPQYRIVEWINELVQSNESNKEIFFTYLSFRNRAVKETLCLAAKSGVKINFVIDGADQVAAKELVSCNPDLVQFKTRGQEGGLGYAHNKFFIINPHSKREFKIVFSSGNMTSGPVIHHENWNFITTHAASHFAQSHICAMNAEWNDNTGRDRASYINSIKKCRLAIKAPEEKDIKVFFVPGEGEPEPGVMKKTAVEYLLNGDNENPGIHTAKKIWIACHRFFYGKMVGALSKRMSVGKKPEMKLIADDDTFYKAVDPAYSIGDTMPEEYDRMKKLMSKGAKVKFMETNGEEHQLHHSKYLIFATYDVKPSSNPIDDFKAVFTGSANLTGAGFNKNWENSYYITIPHVVRAFAEHYVYTWDKLASHIDDLPKDGMVLNKLSEQPNIKK